jgi:hypothetical protein
MIGLFAPARTKARRQRSRVVLLCRDLEGRIQPDGSGVSSAAVAHVASIQAPRIVDFSCLQTSSGVFVIAGRVIDDHPGGLTVYLGGDTSAAGTTTTTAADGTFATVIYLRTDGTDSGYITAWAVDGRGLVSDEVSQFVNPT